MQIADDALDVARANSAIAQSWMLKYTEEVKAKASAAPTRREEWLRIYTAVAAGYASNDSAGAFAEAVAPSAVGKAAAEALLGPLPEPEP